MTKKEQVRKAVTELLMSNGWSTWYHPDYWVHTDVIEDPSRQDYTDYGMNIYDALTFEAYRQKTGAYPKRSPGLIAMFGKVGGEDTSMIRRLHDEGWL